MHDYMRREIFGRKTTLSLFCWDKLQVLLRKKEPKYNSKVVDLRLTVPRINSGAVRRVKYAFKNILLRYKKSYMYLIGFEFSLLLYCV